MFWWLGLALFVDGIDGPIARKLEVKEILPTWSGELLDNIIDYVTYVLIPAFALYQRGFMGEGLSFLSAAIIVVSSAIYYADTGMKTKENFFKGFPVVWNMVVFTLFVIEPGQWVSFAVVVACGILTFVPVNFIHPVRVERLRPINLGMTLLWCAFGALALAQAALPPSTTDRRAGRTGQRLHQGRHHRHRDLPLLHRRCHAVLPQARRQESVTLPTCPICGGTTFGPGPRGRLSPNGKLPRCAGCKSLERHRIFRIMFERLGPENFSDWSAIQFSPDATVDASWFRSFELSVYGEPGGQDIQAIDRPGRRLRHRVLLACAGACRRRPARRCTSCCASAKPDGFVYLAIPDPFREDVTRDWGFPKPEKYGHWRVYGGDVVERFGRIHSKPAGARLSRRGPGDRRARRRIPAAEVGGSLPLDRAAVGRRGEFVCGTEISDTVMKNGDGDSFIVWRLRSIPWPITPPSGARISLPPETTHVQSDPYPRPWRSGSPDL